MKAQLVILLICSIYISLNTCKKLFDPEIVDSAYPKTVNITIQKNIHVLNARKFGRYNNHKANFKKLYTKKKSYTAFPPISEKKINDVPESFHFQGEVNRKPRVKKVLPEYAFGVFRKKRSVGAYVNNTRPVEDKNKNLKRRRNVKKRIKRKGLRNNTRNITSKINKAKRKSKVNKGKSKTKNKNLTSLRNIRSGKKRISSNLRNSNKGKNQTKFLFPGRDLIGSKKKDAKQERKVTRAQEKKVRRYRRLIAGRDAMIQDYPYVVSIQKDHRHWCAGALLNPRIVITTANCVWKSKRMSRMRVRAGSRYMDRGGQLVKIQEVVKHPKWSIRGLPDNDVALLLLNKNIKFSDSVHGVDLPNRAMWPAFEDVWVTSWGAERRDGIFKSMGVTLQVYHALLLDHGKCNNVTMRFGVAVSPNFICVAQTGRRAPCTRDTGAPAVSDGILWGLASWGIRKLCGTERFPAMFSYLASRSNLEFITNATHYLMSDKRYYPFGDRFVVNRALTASTAATTVF